MSKPALVTVVIPTYNRPEFLRRAVASVINQKGVKTQIIIIDDASEVDVCDEYAQQDNITYLRNETNRGGAYCRNRGLQLAESTYINFLDDDDEFLEGKLMKQIQKFDESDVDNLGMVTCHICDMRSGRQEILKNCYKGNIYRETLSRYTVNATLTMLFKTAAVRQINGFDEHFASSQEYDLVIRLSKQFGVDYVDEVLAQANRSVNQINLNFDKKNAGIRRLFHKFDSEYRKMGLGFWIKMRLKLAVLLFRFWVGKQFGESAYRILLRKK